MDKKTISSYLSEIKCLMCDGRYIEAWKRVEFLREQVDYDIKSEEKENHSLDGDKKENVGKLKTYDENTVGCKSNKTHLDTFSEKQDYSQEKQNLGERGVNVGSIPTQSGDKTPDTFSEEVEV